MNILKPRIFFDLEKSNFISLFDSEKPTWNVFSLFKDFFKNHKFKIESKIPKNCFLKNEEFISIEEGVEIEPNTYIEGPCIIKKGSRIKYSAYIRGNVLMDENSTIGHASEVKNSIILKNSSVAHFNYVGDAVIGSNVNLGAGVKLSNLRLDKKEICIFYNGNKINTNLKKFSCIVGDNSQIGCNTVLNPGTIIGKNTIIYANLNVGGYIEMNSIVKPKGKLFFVKTRVIGGKNNEA